MFGILKSRRAARKLAILVIVMFLSTIFSPIVQAEDVSTGILYEAEDAALTGGAGFNDNHVGFSGDGFVDQYGTKGASTAFTVNVASAGDYSVLIRYSNGNDASTLTLLVNDEKIKQMSWASSEFSWDAWANHVETVSLKAGDNKIEIKNAGNDAGAMNLDYIKLSPIASVLYEAEDAELLGGVGFNDNHVGFSGDGFTDMYGVKGASTAFKVNAASAGNYKVTLRYSNGNDTTTISLVLNDERIKQLSLASSEFNWDAWAEHSEVVALNQGDNKIEVKNAGNDNGHINLDWIKVSPTSAAVTAPEAAPEATPVPNVVGWSTNESNAVITKVDGGVNIVNGLGYYNLSKFQDATFKFKATFTEESVWPGFSVRMNDINGGTWYMDNYMYIVKPAIVEVQEFKTDAAPGAAPFLGLDNIWAPVPGVEHEYEISTIDEGSGVRKIFKIDGVEVSNILDEDAPLLTPGYFCINAYAGNVTIKDFKVEVPGGVDASTWSTNSSGASIVEADGGLQVSGGMAYYNVEKFQDAIYRFKATFTKDAQWPGFSVRMNKVEEQTWAAGNYMFIVKPAIVEVQEFTNDGAAGAAPFLGIDNTFMELGVEHQFEISTINEGSGVRKIFKIDGVTVCDILDEEGALVDPGYFVIDSYNVGTVTIKDFTVEKLYSGDTSMWSPTSVSGGTIKAAADGGIKVFGGMAYYNVEKFQDKTFKFKAIMSEDAGWPGFNVRAGIDNEAWGVDTYMYIVKPAIVEVQEFRANGVAGAAPMITFENTWTKPGAEHEYEITTINEGSGVRKIFKIDGTTVSDILDEEGAVVDAGYFVIVAYSGSVTIKDFTVVDIAVEEPIDEEPIDEEPIDEEPIDEEPIDEEPIDEEPIDEEPIDEEPINEEPIDEEPIDEEPIDEEPVTNPDTGVVAIPFAMMALVGAAGLVATRKKIK